MKPRNQNSLARRIQRVSLRTKLVVPILLLAVVPTILIGVFTLWRTRQALRDGAVQSVVFDTQSKGKSIQEFFNAVQQDLRFLSKVRAIRQLTAAQDLGDYELVDRLREEAQRELMVFSQGKRAYYQVRYLNRGGIEIIRLNAREGRPEPVPEIKLQDKSSRYYVRDALSLESGQIYVSRMDLNVERGEIERPERAVLRYAMPVIGTDGKGRALLVINIDAQFLFSLIGPIPAGSEAWLLNAQGVYLGYVGASPEAGEIYRLGRRRHLSKDHTKEDAESILSGQIHGLAAETKTAFYSSSSLTPLSEDSARRWTLLIGRPRAPIESPIRQLTVFLSIVMGLVVMTAVLIGLFVSGYLARPVERLRAATRDIATGDLSKRVDITTGDEIEELASDFNVMTERLREAQEQLSRWNVELAREVASQTEQLQSLQSGLAMADKLASIGQMTAGVMHEVGNPLAAIKTKIQVTQESEDLTADRCQPCLGMMNDVLAEVNRLTVFLRSFSRLSRLRRPEHCAVSLVEIVRDVVALVAPELRRRGLELRTDGDLDSPSIQGNADQLRQLLINLIINASDATPDRGEILVRIETKDNPPQRAGEKHVSVQVIDRGAGIDKDDLQRVWDPFFTTKSDGTGLGMGICKAIVRDHNGEIQIHSTLGEGTTVRVTFPTSPARVEAIGGASDQEEQARAD